MTEKPKLGEILVQAGVIDEVQLAAALGEQARWGRRLGVTLIKMGMVEEGHLVRALAKQLDLPVASLAGKRIADEVIELVPPRIASEHGVVPLFVKKDGRQERLFLGMEDPSNLAVMDDLRFRTGMQIQPVMIGPTDLGIALDRYYLGGSDGDTTDEMSPADHPAGGAPIGEGSLRTVPREAAAPSSRPPASAVPNPSASMPRADREEPEAARVTSPTAPALPDGLLDDVARALEETARTRIVARALAQLLVEKGIVGLDELQSAIAKQKEAASS
jgi:hypothetical protein